MDNNRGRSSFLPMLALVRKNIISAFETITKSNIFRFKLENDKVFYSYMSQLGQKLDKIIVKIADLPKIEFKDSPASIQIQTMGKETIQKIVDELIGLRDEVRKNKPTTTPVQEIKGRVEIKNAQVVPYERMLMSLKSIETRLGNLKLEVPAQKEIKWPEFPKSLAVPEMSKVIDAIEELKSEISKLPKNYPEIEFPNKISVDNFPPQKYPMPVTHISINALAGTVKSSSVTVTTALTPLPSEVLAHRRGLTIYNNSSSTIEVGGSTFAFGDGMPVPAGTYSPALDAGQDMIIYARVASGSANVRVLEVSDINVGR